jgi:hypothetical protein
VYSQFRANLHVRKIVRSGESAIIFLETIKNPVRWKEASSQFNAHAPEDITVSTNLDEETGKYFIKLEGDLDTDIIFILAAFTEVDLYNTWVPFCMESEPVGETTPYKRLTRCLIDFLMFKREALILRYSSG